MAMLTMESHQRNRNSISLDLVQSISSLMDIPKELLWSLLTKIQFIEIQEEDTVEEDITVHIELTNNSKSLLFNQIICVICIFPHLFNVF